MMLPVLVVASLFAQAQPQPAPLDATGYAIWYGADYIAVTAGGALLLSGVTNQIEPLPAGIGPAISLTDTDTAVLLDPRLDDVIGHPMLQEQVPALALGVGLGVTLAGAAGLDYVVHQDFFRTHALVLGGAEAILAAALVTESLKLGVGRLRPDFRERYLRAACGGTIDAPKDLDCTGVVDDGFVVDRETLLDGRRSFPSGHAATAFAGASYLFMHVGSAYLWKDSAPEWGRPLAGLAAGSLLAGAAYVSASRVTDHRHHLDDTAVGAAIGLATGVSAWLLHFDLDGNARRRDLAISPMPLPQGIGVAASGRL